MSYGLVICSVCQREVHQDGNRAQRNGWRHCETKSAMCHGATATYPESKDEIKGEWCGRDDYHGIFTESQGRSDTKQPNKKRAIDRPCSACSAGDYKMEYHDHEPPYRDDSPVEEPTTFVCRYGVTHEIKGSCVDSCDCLSGEPTSSGSKGALKDAMPKQVREAVETTAEWQAATPTATVLPDSPSAGSGAREFTFRNRGHQFVKEYCSNEIFTLMAEFADHCTSQRQADAEEDAFELARLRASLTAERTSREAAERELKELREAMHKIRKVSPNATEMFGIACDALHTYSSSEMCPICPMGMIEGCARDRAALRGKEGE